MKNNDNVSAFDSYEYDEKIRKTLPYYDEFYKQILSIAKMMNIVWQRHNKPISEFINASVLERNQKESFDVITAIQVFHYLSDEDRVIAMKKCQNALRKQGALFYFENFSPNNKECIPLFLQRWKMY